MHAEAFYLSHSNESSEPYAGYFSEHLFHVKAIFDKNTQL